MLPWLYYAITLALGVAGLSLTLIGLPGLWLMVAASATFASLTGWNVFAGTPALLWILGLALAAEVAEFFAGVAGSKSAGGTYRGTVGAIVGGIAGGLLLTIPLFIVGTILGACIGAFAGAMLFEMTGPMPTKQTLAVGWGAFKGRFWGTILKLGFGLVMLIVMAITLLPW